MDVKKSHGYWGYEIAPGGWYNCRTVLQVAPECPHCKAKMGEVKEE